MAVDDAGRFGQQRRHAFELRFELPRFPAIDEPQPFDAVRLAARAQLLEIRKLARVRGDDQLAAAAMRDAMALAELVEQRLAAHAHTRLRPSRSGSRCRNESPRCCARRCRCRRALPTPRPRPRDRPDRAHRHKPVRSRPRRRPVCRWSPCGRTVRQTSDDPAESRQHQGYGTGPDRALEIDESTHERRAPAHGLCPAALAAAARAAARPDRRRHRAGASGLRLPMARSTGRGAASCASCWFRHSPPARHQRARRLRSLRPRRRSALRWRWLRPRPPRRRRQKTARCPARDPGASRCRAHTGCDWLRRRPRGADARGSPR